FAAAGKLPLRRVTAEMPAPRSQSRWSHLRTGAGDDAHGVDAGRQRAERETVVAGQAGRAEGVGDGALAVADEQRRLQGQRHALDDAPGTLLDGVEIAE